MKTLMLTEKNRAVLKIAANQGGGSREELRQYIPLAEKLKFDDVSDMLTACDDKTPSDYELTDMQAALLKTIFSAVAKWPYALAQAVDEVEHRLEQAVTSHAKKTGTSLVE